MVPKNLSALRNGMFMQLTYGAKRFSHHRNTKTDPDADADHHLSTNLGFFLFVFSHNDVLISFFLINQPGGFKSLKWHNS